MIYETLETAGIAFERADHAPVFTCEEARRLVPFLEGAETKNLFLRDAKGKRHFLLAVLPETSVDLKALGAVLGVGSLSFASPERLREHLGIEPGAVSLLAVVNDSAGNVQVIIDLALWEHAAFLCHPLVNTSTLVLQKSGLEQFLTLTNHAPTVVNVPRKHIEIK